MKKIISISILIFITFYWHTEKIFAEGESNSELIGNTDPQGTCFVQEASPPQEGTIINGYDSSNYGTSGTYDNKGNGSYSYAIIWDADGKNPRLEKISKNSPGCNPGQFSGCGISYYGSHEKLETSKKIYDTSGKYLGAAYEIQNNIKFVAGRFIGINAFEEYKKTFYVTINPFCWESNALCRKYVSCTKYYYDSKWNLVTYESVCPITFKGNPSCTEGVQVGCQGPRPCFAPTVESCLPSAYAILASKARTVSTEPSYEGFRQDVNDIEKGIEGADKLPTIEIETYGTVDRGTPQASSYPGGAIVWQTVTIKYYYNLQKACINPITAEVVYVRKLNSKGELDEEPCPKGYIESPELTTSNGEHIGQYYIPLNAKSTDLIKHNLTVDITKSRKTSERLCIALIEKYKKGNDKYERWRMFLADKNGRPFDATTTIQEAKRRVSGADGGCYLVYNSSFRVKQGFYNEVTENGNVYLKGYNFYYRPIDYTNPFPNGIDCDSYWCGLYKKNTNSVEVVDSKNNLTKTYLDKSFDDSTYSIYDIDLNKIRSYNAKNKYTSWDEMNLDGTSSFISGTLNGGYGITRRQCKTFYALGCGPANADWKECQERQNRTVCD